MPILEWNAGRVQQAAADKAESGMLKATTYVESVARDLVRQKSNIHGDNPSLPGEPPARVSGQLGAHITHQVERDATTVRGYVGIAKGSIPDDYARRLELGFVGTDSRGRTYDQAPRPFLRPALLRSRDKIVELIAKG